MANNDFSPELLISDIRRPLWKRLATLLKPAARVDIASAFFSATPELSELAANPNIRLIVRPEYPTSAQAVENALTAPNVEIRGLADKAAPFHEKIFIATDKDGKAYGAYIGSANWTGGGLKRNCEAGVWIRDQAALTEIADHFKSLWGQAYVLSEADVERLRLTAPPPSETAPGGAHRGTLVASWKTLTGNPQGLFLMKQNGTKDTPFWEAEEDFRDRRYNHSSQTLSELPSEMRPGQGILLSWIAVRKDGRRDRLVYGRGRIAGFDRSRWRLPTQYLKSLPTSGVAQSMADWIARWPEIIWLDPVEVIAYPRACKDYLWYSELTGFSEFRNFRRGVNWIPQDAWLRCNEALDRHTDRFRLQRPDRTGIWWNHYTEILDPEHPLFMTKDRIEEMNLSDG